MRDRAREIFRGLIRNDDFKSTAKLESRMDAPVMRVENHPVVRFQTDQAKVYEDARFFDGSPFFKADDWSNRVTGVGTSGDKKMYGVLNDTVLGVRELDSVYQSSVLGSSICDIPAYEKLRQGFQVRLTDGDNDPGQLDAFKTEIQSYDTTQKFTMGEVFSSLYGGGGIYIGVDDGLNPWDPIDYSRIRSVDYLTLLDRYELVNASTLDMNVKSANFARPIYYSLATIDPTYAGVKIHYSRIIRFDGIQMSRRRMAFFYYWGQSIINRTIGIISGYEQGLGAISTMVQDFNTLIYEMKNLPQILAGGAVDKKWFQKKIAATVEMMSALQCLVVGEGEKVDHISRNVSGLPDLIDRLVGQVVMAAKIPKLLLFGESATTGQNANSDGEVRMFYDYIKSQQVNELEPKLRKLIKIFMASKSGAFAGNIVPFQIVFNPLWQMDEKDQTTVQYQSAQTDALNIQNQIYSPEEARSKYKNGKFNLNISLDEDLEAKVKTANKPVKGNSKLGGVDDPNTPKEKQTAPYAIRVNGAMSNSEIFPSRKI